MIGLKFLQQHFYNNIMTITPSEEFLQILDPLPYTSRSKVTKPFIEQSSSVRGKVFEVLNLILQKSFQLHYIQRSKRPERSYPHISRDQFYSVVGRNWNEIRDFLQHNKIIEPYLSDEEKESYATGFSDVGTPIDIEPFSKSWRIRPKYFSTKHFDFLPITDKPLDRVTLHPSINDQFTSITKHRKWNKAIEFIQKHQVHVFNTKPITKVTKSKYGRVFHKVNTLPSQIREFIQIDGEDTETLDYSSCSLTILYPLLSDINGERSNWLQMLQHPQGAYQHIANKLKTTRDIIKKDVVRWVGCRGKDQPWGEFKMNQYLSKHQPIFYADIQNGDVDLVEYTQRVESEIIVESLGDRGYSIHDAILVKEKDVNEVSALMEKIMGHFTACKGIDDFDMLDLMLSDHHQQGVSSKPKLEPKEFYKSQVRQSENN